MRERALAGYGIFHPDDGTFDTAAPGVVQPSRWPEVYALDRARVRGVEKSGKRFLARPMFEGRRYCLGEFDRREDAERVTEAFWLQHLGIFWALGGYMRFHLRAAQLRPRRVEFVCRDGAGNVSVMVGGTRKIPPAHFRLDGKVLVRIDGDPAAPADVAAWWDPDRPGRAALTIHRADRDRVLRAEFVSFGKRYVSPVKSGLARRRKPAPPADDWRAWSAVVEEIIEARKADCPGRAGNIGDHDESTPAPARPGPGPEAAGPVPAAAAPVGGGDVHDVLGPAPAAGDDLPR